MEMLQEIMVSVAMLVLSLVLVMGLKFWKTFKDKAYLETRKIRDDEQRKLAQDAVVSADNLVYKTVAAIEQTAAKELRALVKAGKAPRSDLEKMGKRAISEVKSLLKHEYSAAIEKNFGNLNDYLAKSVEAAVLMLKRQV